MEYFYLQVPIKETSRWNLPNEYTRCHSLCLRQLLYERSSGFRLPSLAPSTHHLLISMLLHVGRELDEPELVGGDGASFPWRRRRRLDHVGARDRRRRFPGVGGLGERLDILRRSRLQSWLPELLKMRKSRDSKLKASRDNRVAVWSTAELSLSRTSIRYASHPVAC